MKRFIAILFAVLLSLSVFAEIITLSYKKDNDEKTKDNRSLSLMPTASHDGNVITLYSEKALENVGIYVVDAHGGVLYGAEESTLVGGYTFVLYGNPKGTLFLVIQTSEGYYEGEFSIE